MIRLSSALALAGGLATGAGLMYLLDPDLGSRRRERAKRRLGRATHRAAVSARESAQELGDRARAALNGKSRHGLHLPRSRAGKVAVGTLAAAALAGSTIAARALTSPDAH